MNFHVELLLHGRILTAWRLVGFLLHISRPDLAGIPRATHQTWSKGAAFRFGACAGNRTSSGKDSQGAESRKSKILKIIAKLAAIDKIGWLAASIKSQTGNLDTDEIREHYIDGEDFNRRERITQSCSWAGIHRTRNTQQDG